MKRELKEMVTDADMERLQAVAEPLTDMFDEIEGDGSECYITWNFGYNKYGEITCGFDVRMHPRYEDDKQKVEEIKARIDDALELCGFELDSDIKHANPSENIFGGWHYQIKKIDDTDADVELTTDDMNAGQWYESLDKDEWDGFFSHNRDLDECDEKFEEDFNVDWENNRKAKAEVVSWWKDVEKWNKENGSKFNIDNDYSDVESMFTAIYDMLSELKTANKDLYKKGKAIYNKYAYVPIDESLKENNSDEWCVVDEDSGTIIKEKIFNRLQALGVDNWYDESLNKGDYDRPGFEDMYLVCWDDQLGDYHEGKVKASYPQEAIDKVTKRKNVYKIIDCKKIDLFVSPSRIRKAEVVESLNESSDMPRRAMFANGFKESLNAGNETKVLKEDFQLNPRKGYYLNWCGKKFAVYYFNKVDIRFWEDMIYTPITEYVKKFDYAVEFFGTGFYIFDNMTEDFKFLINIDYKDYKVVDYGTLVATLGNEMFTKDFITYEELIYAIVECFDKFITTGHIEEIREEPEVDAEKVKVLKLMHKTMQGMNNENAYYSWIVTGVPDGAYEEDYESIASDDDEYNDVVDLFNRIFKRYAKDGLFKPSPDEAQFAKEKCKELGIPEIEIF